MCSVIFEVAKSNWTPQFSAFYITDGKCPSIIDFEPTITTFLCLTAKAIIFYVTHYPHNWQMYLIQVMFPTFLYQLVLECKKFLCTLAQVRVSKSNISHNLNEIIANCAAVKFESISEKSIVPHLNSIPNRKNRLNYSQRTPFVSLGFQCDCKTPHQFALDNRKHQ